VQVEKGPHLIHDRVEDLPAQKISGNSKFSVEKADLRVIRIFHVEARKVEHGI